MPNHPTNPNVRLHDRFFYLDPHPHFRWLRENAPVYWDATADGGLWGVACYDDVMAVSRDHETFCSGKSSRPERDSWIPSMINLDDPLHKRRRNLVNRGFTPKRVEAHEPMLRALTNELLDKVEPAGRCDFVLDVARWIPMVVIGDMLGVAPEDREQLLVWSDEMLGGGESQKIADDEQRRLRQREVVNGYFAYAAASLAERRVRPRDDLMSILAHAEVEGDRLTDEEILQESLLILIGGDETTRHVMTGGLFELLRRPAQQKLLAENAALIPSAVEEMLRWVSPIQNMNRTATRDTELRGQKIRAGDRLLLLYPSANRDAAAFERADELDVTRYPNRHVAFGGFGTHHCLGASLARLELRVLLEELLRRFPNIALDEGELHVRPSNFIVGLESMPVRLR
ncbi:MAG: cytochrome P450 [Deltaproteobacteria bacterium]|nr:cytochrome P450 [Deltaproteobacteria bacterium]